MSRLFALAAAFCLLTAPLVAQELKVPAEIKGAPGAWIIVAPEIVDGGKPKWRVDQQLQEVPLGLLLPPEVLTSLRGKVFQSTTPGRFKIEVWNAKDNTPSDIYICWVIIEGPPPPPPPPTPPGPPVPPQPPVPVPTGARGVTLIRESSSQSTKLADLVRDLRNPTTLEFKYLKEHNHSLDIIDPDQVGSDGKLLIESWKTVYAGKALPVLVIYDKQTRTVISADSIPANTSDPNVVIDAIKKAGG